MLSNLKKYDQILESFSQPLMNILNYEIDNTGILTVKNNDPSFYAFLDYTRYVEYLFACIAQTIETDLKKELAFIIEYDKVKTGITGNCGHAR